MRQVVVLSGKGGTGKTSVTAALAHLAARERRVVLVDADVDAANLGITARPEVRVRHTFKGGQVAVVAAAACEACGACARACRFGAIVRPGVIDGLRCEGCAACFHRCPTGAISMVPQITGEWFESATRFGRLFHARLHPGSENSGKLVAAIRDAARQYTARTGSGLVLIDGPPGIGCPVIAAATGCDAALVVTEPTISGAEDLERALGTLRHFRIPALAVVNKADLNPAWATKIENRCRDAGIEVAARIPFDRAVTRAMVRRLAVTEEGAGPAAVAVRKLYERLRADGASAGVSRSAPAWTTGGPHSGLAGPGVRGRR